TTATGKSHRVKAARGPSFVRTGRQAWPHSRNALRESRLFLRQGKRSRPFILQGKQAAPYEGKSPTLEMRAWGTRKDDYFRRTWQRRPSSALRKKKPRAGETR